jgi:hypothetical protein
VEVMDNEATKGSKLDFVASLPLGGCTNRKTTRETAEPDQETPFERPGRVDDEPPPAAIEEPIFPKRTNI